MAASKSGLKKRFSGVVRKIFNRQDERVKPAMTGSTRRRSLPVRDRPILTESAVWRHNVEQLCKEYDSRDLNNGSRGTISLVNIRRKTEEYRRELSGLKRQAGILKNQRDDLYAEMNNFRHHPELLKNHQRRRSFASSRRY